MFLFLSKFLPLLVYPLGLASILILVSLFIRQPRWQKGILALAFVVLYLGGNGWVAHALAKSLEWRYLPPEEIPQADVIVVLAGDERSAQYPRQTPEVGEAGDRVIYASWLYQQGAAPAILFSGGSIKWLSVGSSPKDAAAYFLEMMGVPRKALWYESESRNTYESAVACRKILDERGIGRVILVTSAAHMPRSVALFERQGIEVIPAPTDYTVTQSVPQHRLSGRLPSVVISLLPSTEYLEITTRMLKEYFGIFIYKLRGWL